MGKLLTALNSQLFCILLYFTLFFNINNVKQEFLIFSVLSTIITAMSLAEKLNTEKDKLAFSSGGTIYVMDEGKPEPITRRKKYVKSLTVHAGRLFDSGNFNGINDTLAGNSILGRMNSWSHIASAYGNIFGVLNKEVHKSMPGIWLPKEMELVAPRSNDTWILCGNGGALLESGDYINMDYGFSAHLHPDDPYLNDPYNRHVFETFSGKTIIESYGGQPYENLAIWNSNLVVSTGRNFFSQNALDKRGMTREDIALQDYDVHGFFGRLYEIWMETFKNPDADKEMLWNEWSGIVAQNLDKISKSSLSYWVYMDSSVRHRHIWQAERKKLHFEPLEFKEACKKYEWIKDYHWKKYLHDSSELDYLCSVICNVSKNIMQKLLDKTNITSMAVVDDTLFFGDRLGRLKMHDLTQPPEQEESQLPSGKVVTEFKKPIYAMTTIPEEVFDDGIKQEIARRRRLRYCHAKREKGNIIFLRKAA